MKRGIYRGPIRRLDGEPASLREFPGNPELVYAQFDSFQAERAGVPLANGWHTFYSDDFEEPDHGILGKGLR